MIQVELYGTIYHFYEGDEEFGKRINKSPNTLSKMTNHPARIKDKGRVLWCLELWAENLLATRINNTPEYKIRYFPKAADFESHLRLVKS